MKALLEVNNISKSSFLAPISFTLERKKTLAITGANNSGKSTLANIIVGIEKSDTGDIFLNGQPLETSNFKQRCQHIRMIFQHAKDSINPAITIRQLLEETLILNTVLDAEQRLEKIAKTLRLVGLLPDHASFYPNMMSNGQLQRVAIARAIILDPQVIVADEPLAALDPSVRSQIVNLLLRLQSQLGIAYVFISHHLAIIKHISDRVLIMKDGKVIESGETKTVFANPEHEYTKQMLDSYQMNFKV